MCKDCCGRIAPPLFKEPFEIVELDGEYYALFADPHDLIDFEEDHPDVFLEFEKVNLMNPSDNAFFLGSKH